jgi:hypothetical protein
MRDLEKRHGRTGEASRREVVKSMDQEGEFLVEEVRSRNLGKRGGLNTFRPIRACTENAAASESAARIAKMKQYRFILAPSRMEDSEARGWGSGGSVWGVHIKFI